MIEAIEAAIQGRDYTKAARLLQALDPEDPWTQIAQAQLQTAQHQWEQAEEIYRTLLRQDYGPKVILAARQGLQQLQPERTQDRQQAIAEAIAKPHQTELGALILEAMPAEPVAQKNEAIQHMARIMNIEPYSARLLLSGKGIRLYRIGAIGELEFYGQQLKDHGIPAFWVTLSELQSVQVHTVSHFKSIQNPVRAIIQQGHGADQKLYPLEFTWKDVYQRIEGQIPIFEEVVDLDVRGKLLRKEKTQDHAQCCDLHLKPQNCIIRIYDAAYHFNQGVSLAASDPTEHALDHNTSWANWRQLSQMIGQQVPQQPHWSDFNTFAETALDHPDLLSKLPAHIDLFRREDSNWDPAFHLYSVALFLKNR